MRVFESLAASLAMTGVDTVFGLVGEGNISLATQLHREHGVSYVAARREDGAVAMADGYARASGKLGVATVTHGPGLTNTVTALTEAARARTLLLLLAGAIGLSDRSNRQLIDQRAVAQAAGAFVVDVTSPAQATDDLFHAMTHALTTRGPVVLNLHTDVQEAVTATCTRTWRCPDLQRTTPEATAVDAVADLLTTAQRPVIVAGRGAVLADARFQLNRLATELGALVCTSLFAKGFFAGDPYDLGVCGGFASKLAARLISESDCVLAFGASLNPWTTGKGRMFTGTVVQCDTDPHAIGRWLAPDHVLVGDAAAAASALADVVAARPTGSARYRTPRVAKDIAEYDVATEFPQSDGAAGLDVHPVSLLLDQALPADRQIVVDVGHFMSVPSRYVRVPDAFGYISPSSFGAIGLSLPMAVGVATARPERLTVCFVGDGGPMMCLQELDTARRHNLALLVVAMNDNAYGAEVHISRHRGEPDDLAWFSTVDFAATSEGLGVPARIATTLPEISSAVQELLQRGGPALLDVRLDANISTKYFRDFAGATARTTVQEGAGDG